MRDASLREDRVVFLKKQVAATEEELRKKNKKTLAAVSSNNNPSAIVSQRQKRKLTVDKRGKEKRVKEEDEKDPEAKNCPAPRRYRWRSGEVELEEEKSHAEKNCPMPKPCQNILSFEVKKEEPSEDRPNENYKMAMKIIQEGLNHIKRDPRTSSQVMGAIKVLEDEANRN